VAAALRSLVTADIATQCPLFFLLFSRLPYIIIDLVLVIVVVVVTIDL
jgi:hypothetical protein